MKRILPYALACILLLSAVFIVSIAANDRESITRTDKSTPDEPAVNREMRGVWVTFMTLDTEYERDKEAAFSRKIDTIIADMKSSNLNTMFVHVRPFCDAIYPSQYYPWSHIITGTQGEDPGFDPLGMICEKCRAEGISVHGWINPYRVSTASTPSAFSEDHPYSRDNTLGVLINGEIILNPADERVRELIVKGVVELLENYDLDGIQFDDYFYPEDCGDFDAEEYAAYVSATASPLSLADFRMENVNKLICEVYQAVHQTDPHAVFGISPQGALDNNEVLYADVKRWCAEEGYIDYICPQLYYSLDNPYLNYEDALHQWLSIERHAGLKFCVGLGVYKAGTDADEGTWLDNHDILKTEIDILRREQTDGFILFSYDSLHAEAGREEVENMKSYLTTPAQ